MPTAIKSNSSSRGLSPACGGKDIRFNHVVSYRRLYGGRKRISLHIIAISFCERPELLNRDLFRMSYAPVRARLVELRRMINAIQWRFCIPMLCAPISGDGSPGRMGGRVHPGAGRAG
ncbi:MAG: hypothetical protein GDA36_05995 [Rhodobacteraceae bacterium]|nr:hypothetical protein [Paracoccaceae bacterium]